MGAGESAAEWAEQKRAQARQLGREASNCDQGAEGERFVGAILDDRLPAEYVVFHDLRIPGSKANIDHLVVGPSGVFAIDSKNYSNAVTLGIGRGADRIWTGGSSIDLRGCVWGAFDVERRIGLPVKAVMCIITPSLPKPVFDFGGVRICSPTRVVAELTMGSSIALDIERISERIAKEFGAEPQLREPERSLGRAIRTGRRLSDRPWFPLVRVAAVALVALSVLPLLAPASSWAGAVISDLLFSDLVPTTVPKPSSPPTSVATPPTTIFAAPAGAAD